MCLFSNTSFDILIDEVGMKLAESEQIEVQYFMVLI